MALTRRQLLSLAPWPVLSTAGLLSRGALAQTDVIVASQSQKPVEPVRWPQDHGAHLSNRAEWWNLKGEIKQASGRTLGFHIAFFRSAVESAAHNPSHFAPKHVIAARASLSDAAKGLQLHDERVARIGFGLVDATPDDMHITLHDWSLERSGPVEQSVFHSRITTPDFALDLRCIQTQVLMLHGDNGVIHKDAFLGDPTRYYSQAQLKLEGQLSYQKQRLEVRGRAWLDHGWGKRMMASDAIGSDWICMNLNDGSALMVFRMRRQDGSAVWEGATLRQAGRPDHIFKHEEIRMTPGQTWRSPATGAQYPVAWRIDLAGTSYAVRARMQAQEVDSGNGIGDVFWEGLSDLLDGQGRVIGAGYLEMTGYAAEMLM
jgi:predicted secreted hydrolase